MFKTMKDTRRTTLLALTILAALVWAGPASAQTVDFQNGFEADLEGWEQPNAPWLEPTRVPSGSNGIPSADGGWHATAGRCLGDWGGYEIDFPKNGYQTSISIHLDTSNAFPGGSLSFSSAINDIYGGVLSDFVINIGIDPYDQGRFVAGVGVRCGESPNSPDLDPQSFEAIPGWYTIRHTFSKNRNKDHLRVDVDLLDASGQVVAHWDDPLWQDTDGDGEKEPLVPIGIVGGNRWAYFCYNSLGPIHFDNSEKIDLGADVKTVGVDLKPGNGDNRINPNSHALVPLAILGEAGFDPVSEVDLASIMVRGARPSYTKFDIDDVDDDGDRDLVLYFRARDFHPRPTAAECGSPDARLRLDPGSATLLGVPLAGEDSVLWHGPDCSH